MTRSRGSCVTHCRPANDSQLSEDDGLMERIEENVSRLPLAAFESEISMSSFSSACKATEATPGTAVHGRKASVKLSNTSILAVAKEKCTILQPRATENPQIPISTIAVQKRISARIDVNPSPNPGAPIESCRIEPHPRLAAP